MLEGAHPCLVLSLLDYLVMRAMDAAVKKRTCVPYGLWGGKFSKYAEHGCIYCNARFDQTISQKLGRVLAMPKGFRVPQAAWSVGDYPVSRKQIEKVRRGDKKVQSGRMKSLFSYGFKVERRQKWKGKKPGVFWKVDGKISSWEDEVD